MDFEITNLNKYAADPSDDDACRLTIGFTAIIFLFFYGSLIIIIAVMYWKYRKELTEMEKNNNPKDNF